MSLRLLRALAPLLVLLGVLAPRVGRTCAATPLELRGTTPADGGQLPANAAIRFDGPVTFAAVTVTVDGQPAALEPFTGFPYTFGVDFMRVTPTPSPGQTVVLAGDFCSPQEPPCDTTLTFMTTAPDLDAPAAATALEFDLQQFPEEGGAGSCAVTQDHAWFARWDSALAGADASPTAHVLEIATDESFSDVRDQQFVAAAPGRVDARLSLLTHGEGAPESFCLRVRTLDLAGNEGPTSETVCTPLHCRVEPDDYWIDPMSTGYGEPSWAPEDMYAGGPCGGAPESGCGCTAPTSPGPAWLLLTLLPLGARRPRPSAHE